MTRTNINTRLRNAGKVFFVFHDGTQQEVKSRTLYEILKEVGGFSKKALRDFERIDTFEQFHYTSGGKHFSIRITG